MDLYPGLESHRERETNSNTYGRLVPSSLPEERLFSPLLDDGSHLLQKQETMRKSVFWRSLAGMASKLLETVHVANMSNIKK